MSLESILTKLVEAIDKNTAAILSRAPAPAPTTETATAATVTTAAITKPKEQEKPKPIGATEEDITALMQVLLDKGKKADLKALNAEFGVERGRMLFGTDKMQPYFDRLTALNT